MPFGMMAGRGRVDSKANGYNKPLIDPNHKIEGLA